MLGNLKVVIEPPYSEWGNIWKYLIYITEMKLLGGAYGIGPGTAALNPHRDRAPGWSVVRTMVRGVDGVYDRHHHQTVRWPLAAR